MQHRQAIISGPLHFASPMQLGIPTTCLVLVFLQADHIPVELVSGGSVSSTMHDDKKDKANLSRIEPV